MGVLQAALLLAVAILCVSTSSANVVKRQAEEDADCAFAQLDMMFVIDMSGSIRVDRWPMVVFFLEWVIGEFHISPVQVRVGMVTFQSTAMIRWDLDDHMDQASLIQAVRNIEYTRGSTNIADGLRKAQDIFKAPNRGDRRNIDDVVLLVTDGVPNKEADMTLEEARKTRELPSRIVTVGITRQANATLLGLIAGDPSLNVMARDFSVLNETAHDVNILLCPEPTTPRPTTTTRRPPPPGRCYFCTDYNQQGYGFIEHPDDDQCFMYYLCRIDVDTNEIILEVLQQCPPGTVYSREHGPSGLPCLFTWEVDVPAVCNPPLPTQEPIDRGTCPYEVNPGQENIFGRRAADGSLVDTDSCGPNGRFDTSDEVCACVLFDDSCLCRLYIPFATDVQDKSCTESWVSSSMVPVDVSGQGGFFSGYSDQASNGAHLKSWSLSGAYSALCEHGGQFKLSVATWFNADGPLSSGPDDQGLISYAHCIPGADPSFYLWIRGNRLCGGLKTRGNDLVELCSDDAVSAGQWYYAAMVYDAPDLRLYMAGRNQHDTCTANPSSCLATQGVTVFGCLESRNCGVNVGMTGVEKIPSTNGFFRGRMEHVQIADIADYNGCPNRG